MLFRSAMATNYLEDIRLKEGVYAYQIQCDAVLNPPGVIDKNEMRARIGVQPTKTAEFIFVELIAQNTRGEAGA